MRYDLAFGIRYIFTAYSTLPSFFFFFLVDPVLVADRAERDLQQHKEFIATGGVQDCARMHADSPLATRASGWLEVLPCSYHFRFGQHADVAWWSEMVRWWCTTWHHQTLPACSRRIHIDGYSSCMSGG